MEERPKPFLKIYLIDLDSAYHHKEKTITFCQFLINCGEKSQGRPNSVLKWRPRGPRDVHRTSIWKYIIKHIIVVLFSILPLHQMYCGKYWKVNNCIFSQFWRRVIWTFSKRPKKYPEGNVLGTSPGRQYWTSRTFMHMHIHCIIINFISPMCAWNTKELVVS